MSLVLPFSTGIVSENAGLLVSRGRGRHPSRVIESHELIYVDSGTLPVQEGGVPHHVSAGETILLHPGVPHGGIADYRPDLRFYWIHFRLAAANAALSASLNESEKKG